MFSSLSNEHSALTNIKFQKIVKQKSISLSHTLNKKILKTLKSLLLSHVQHSDMHLHESVSMN